ncbi:MAG: TGS domain-containing protein, partial [Myxococcaceae bacterium]
MAESIQITLPDGSTKAAPSGIRVGDFVKESIGPGLAKAAILARFNGNEVDLSRPLTESGKLEVLTAKAPEALETIRHDAAHVVASAVQKLFPGTQVTIGPTIEGGFYYDFFRDRPFTPEELQAIEEESNKEIAKNLPFVREEVNVADAIHLFQSKGEKFKVEIIEDIV